MVSFNRQPHSRTKPLTCGPNRCEGLYPRTNRGEFYDPENHESVTKNAAENCASRMVSVSGPSVDTPILEAIRDNLELNETVDTEIVNGYDISNGREVCMKITTSEDGTETTTFTYLDDGTTMTNTPSFTKSTPNPDKVQDAVYFATANDGLALGDPQFGEIVELTRTAVYDSDNAVQSYTYRDVAGNDVTAVVTAAPYTLSVAQQRHMIATGTADVTASQTLSWNALATYAEIYINAQDANVVWDINGVAPTANYSEEENSGVTIRLLDRDEMDGFNIAAADEDGNPDPLLTARIGWREWNIAPDED